MHIIDHIYIDILPWSVHVTINRYFSTFATQQQRTHEQQFPRSQIIPYIMSTYWDHAMSQPSLLIALNCLQSKNDMKLYNLISNAWNKYILALLQRASNIHTIGDALVYNRSRLDKIYFKAQWSQLAIPEPCESTLM